MPRIAHESYIDADDATVAHLSVVAKRIAATQVRVFDAVRPGLVVLGLDVPHLHIHVLPLHRATDIAPSAARAVGEEDLDEAMNRLREGLREDGWGRFVPMRMASPVLDLVASVAVRPPAPEAVQSTVTERPRPSCFARLRARP